MGGRIPSQAPSTSSQGTDTLQRKKQHLIVEKPDERYPKRSTLISPVPRQLDVTCPCDVLRAQCHFCVILSTMHNSGLPWWLSGKESICQCRSHEFSPWSGKIPHVVEQLSLSTTAIEAVLQSPGVTTTEALAPSSLCYTAREATAMRSPGTATRRAPACKEDPAQPKISTKIKFKSLGW